MKKIIIASTFLALTLGLNAKKAEAFSWGCAYTIGTYGSAPAILESCADGSGMSAWHLYYVL